MPENKNYERYEKKAKVKRIPSPRFYVFVGVIAAAVVAVVFLLSGVDTITVEQGEISFEYKAPVVLVRDEQVISAENYGKATYLKQEGERVESGTAVAEVYKWGYNDNIMNQLIDVESSILQYQETKLMSDADDPDLSSLNKQIMDKAAEAKQIITGELPGDILLAEQQLKDLMDQKQSYLNGAVEADQLLEQYYSKEEQLNERIEGWREVLAAPVTGTVSYYFDGAESVLNAENIQNIRLADISDILYGAQQKEAVKAEETIEKPLYRIVNNFKWYLVLDTGQPVIEFETGSIHAVVFDELLDRQYEAKVFGNVSTEGEQLYMFEITEDIGELLTTRRAEATIYRKFEGLKIPVESIKTVEGEQGVYVVTDDGKTFVPVNVKIIQEDQAIVEPVDEAALSVGMEIQS
ncbi:MAG: HlyD family efflux transporter periplasmic adaptor subunit [Christensenellaceae bacterium]